MARAFHGWAMVAACFTMALFAWGIGFYGMGVFFVLLRDSRGFSSPLLSVAMTAYFLLGAFVIGALGFAWERFGARVVVGTGACAFAAGLVVLAGATGLAQLGVAYALLALGWGTTSSAAINMAIAPWFERRRGLALSLALTGASASGVVFPPLMVLVFERVGLETGLLALAALTLAVLLPIALFVLVPAPAARGQFADGAESAPIPKTALAAAAPWSARAALRLPAFWAITVSFALGLMVQVGFLTHQIAIIEPTLTRTGAALAVSLAGTMAVIGRLLTGLLLDRYSRRGIAAANFLLLGAALLMVALANEPWLVFLACSLYGLGLGNLVSLPGLLLQEAFSAAHFTRVTGLVVGICQLVYSAGPALFGAARALTGSYALALEVGAGLFAIAAVAVLAGRRQAQKGNV